MTKVRQYLSSHLGENRGYFAAIALVVVMVVVIALATSGGAADPLAVADQQARTVIQDASSACAPNLSPQQLQQARDRYAKALLVYQHEWSDIVGAGQSLNTNSPTWRQTAASLGKFAGTVCPKVANIKIGLTLLP